MIDDNDRLQAGLLLDPDAGTIPARPSPIVLSRNDPFPSAKKLLEARWTFEGVPTLIRHRATWWEFDRTCYRRRGDECLRTALYETLDKAFVMNTDGDLLRFRPKRGSVRDLQEAMQAVASVDSRIEPPAWLHPELPPPPGGSVAVSNGWLDPETRSLRPHTPAWFSTSCAPVAFEPDAPSPERWYRFLGEVWPNDPQSVQALQEWFGYLLSQDTSMQKALFIVGPPRSGKGTVGRLLSALVGQANVAGPTLASLGQRFGLWPLIDRSVAIVSDARVDSRVRTAVVEQFLRITGEDTIDVDRKYAKPWTGRVPARFVLLGNEVLRIRDPSGAFASRFIVLRVPRSVPDKRRDPELSDKLAGELPGILLWALDGLLRLRSRGRFLQPAAAERAVEALDRRTAPHKQFLEERCRLVAGHCENKETLFAAWAAWCEDHGDVDIGTSATLGRALHELVPDLGERRPRDREGRTHEYVGIRLRRDDEK